MQRPRRWRLPSSIDHYTLARGRSKRPIVRVYPVGRQANANSFTPANPNLEDADIDRVGGSRLNGAGTRSAVLHGADFGSHGFHPGRDRDEERVGAEYRHVRAL